MARLWRVAHFVLNDFLDMPLPAATDPPLPWGNSAEAMQRSQQWAAGGAVGQPRSAPHQPSRTTPAAITTNAASPFSFVQGNSGCQGSDQMWEGDNDGAVSQARRTLRSVQAVRPEVVRSAQVRRSQIDGSIGTYYWTYDAHQHLTIVRACILRTLVQLMAGMLVATDAPRASCAQAALQEVEAAAAEAEAIGDMLPGSPGQQLDGMEMAIKDAVLDKSPQVQQVTPGCHASLATQPILSMQSCRVLLPANCWISDQPSLVPLSLTMAAIHGQYGYHNDLRVSLLQEAGVAAMTCAAITGGEAAAAAVGRLDVSSTASSRSSVNASSILFTTGDDERRSSFDVRPDMLRGALSAQPDATPPTLDLDQVGFCVRVGFLHQCGQPANKVSADIWMLCHSMQRSVLLSHQGSTRNAIKGMLDNGATFVKVIKGCCNCLQEVSCSEGSNHGGATVASGALPLSVAGSLVSNGSAAQALQSGASALAQAQRNVQLGEIAQHTRIRNQLEIAQQVESTAAVSAFAAMAQQQPSRHETHTDRPRSHPQTNSALLSVPAHTRRYQEHALPDAPTSQQQHEPAPSLSYDVSHLPQVPLFSNACTLVRSYPSVSLLEAEPKTSSAG